MFELNIPVLMIHGIQGTEYLGISETAKIKENAGVKV